MTIKTKSTIKKALALTGLGLLLAGAIGNFAIYCKYMAQRHSKANITAKAESNIYLTSKKNIALDENNNYLTLNQSDFFSYDLWEKFVLDYAHNEYLTLDYDTRFEWVKYSINTTPIYSSNGYNYTFNTFAMVKSASTYNFYIYFSNNYSSPSYTSAHFIEIQLPLADLGATNPYVHAKLNMSSSNSPIYNGGLVIQTQSNPLYNYWYDYYQSQQGGGDTPVVPDPEPTPQNYDFTFNASPNMNAPLGFNVESIILPQPSNQESVPFFVDYDMPYFTSNGQRFNQIRIFYNIGRDIGYLDKNGSYVMNTTANTCMATNMIFKDTATNSAVSVYTRVQTSMQDSEGAVYPWTNSWKWKSNNYRYLTFEEMPSTTQIDHLSNLNTGYDTIYQNATTEIGLGGAFTILGSAFSAWSNIFAIQVIPGISIGLLFFMPLIVGIIILVIWIIKR